MGKRVYAVWSGNEKGVPENTDKCIAVVWPTDGWISHQCRRKRGYGADGLYCRQHARVHNALESGLLETVKRLTKEGMPPTIKFLAKLYGVSMKKILLTISDYHADAIMLNVAIGIGNAMADLDVADQTAEYMGDV